MSEPAGMRLAILDIDGTLVDTNYQHTLAWFRAFQKAGISVPVWRIHRHIGMGGDQLIEALTDESTENQQGDQIREFEGDFYEGLVEEVQVLPHARDLIVDLKGAGVAVVLASSAKDHEVDHYLELLDARSLVDGWTSSKDVDATKPAPDLIESALAKVEHSSAVLVGDSVWDCKAARGAGIDSIGVLTGGFGEQKLLEAGAMTVYPDLGGMASSIIRLDDR